MGNLHLSVWTYPWDVAEQGILPVVEEVRGLGLNTVSLATSYHAGRFVQPRGKRRKSYFPEDGTVYFRPSPTLWADAVIQPKVAAQVEEDGDMLRALVDARQISGIRTSCWTVCLHNTRLGMLQLLKHDHARAAGNDEAIPIGVIGAAGGLGPVVEVR